MKRRKRRWELEEPKKEIIVPTLKEIMEKENLSLKEAAKKAIQICGEIHLKAKRDCFRKLSGHELCDGCPKYYPKRKKGSRSHG